MLCYTQYYVLKVAVFFLLESKLLEPDILHTERSIIHFNMSWIPHEESCGFKFPPTGQMPTKCQPSGSSDPT